MLPDLLLGAIMITKRNIDGFYIAKKLEILFSVTLH